MQISHDRTQHPVGQGGFHTGHVRPETSDLANGGGSSLRYIYDCGSLNAQGKTYIDNWAVASAGAHFDYLFLSHLDADHVNKVDTLLRAVGVGTVVMPYLNDEERVLALARAALRGKDLTVFYGNLVADPATALREIQPSLRIVFVNGEGSSPSGPEGFEPTTDPEGDPDKRLEDRDGKGPGRFRLVRLDADGQQSDGPALPTTFRSAATGQQVEIVANAEVAEWLGEGVHWHFKPFVARRDDHLCAALIEALRNDPSLVDANTALSRQLADLLATDTGSNASPTADIRRVRHLFDIHRRIIKKRNERSLYLYSGLYDQDATTKRMENTRRHFMTTRGHWRFVNCEVRCDARHVDEWPFCTCAATDWLCQDADCRWHGICRGEGPCLQGASRRFDKRAQTQVHEELFGTRHGWLGTGDAHPGKDRAELQAFYAGERNRIQTVVIPHHGSIANHDPDFYAHFKPMNAIANAAPPKNWAHPHRTVMIEIMRTSSPHIVDHEACSRFEERFTIRA